ncbi:hypothetical protein WN944_015855 [Citrus x changshan-huyou]|uniref:TIR domain-containing protein n=1 Tax=Citrus x changshan-huyou TaxID=2935761 RepID=A0AAP0M9T4_9ROSI
MAFSSSSSCIYEVFLNFRGEDTRAIFTCHLYDALFKRKKFRTFIDDEELRRGDEISPALLKAIQGSKISVVVFSKDYASSKWCLNELVKILDCKNMKGHIIIPVFYGVSPSDVRHQTGIFGVGFGKLEQQFKEQPEMVRKWRDALTESSHLAGHESTKFRHDAQLLDKIVEDVLKKLEKLTVSTDSSNGLVGLNSRIEQIKPFLCMDSSDTVQIVGIWGMGGIGKTTLATAIFDQFSSEFEGRCFFSDVRRNSETGVGLEHLQKQTLSTILSEKLELAGPNIPQFTKERVRRMKVLIVLDDVNKVGQLEGLIGGLDQYGPGSRIVVTTRDKGVLEKFGVEEEKIYRVNGLEFYEAFELFYYFAFKENHCPTNLRRHSWRVVDLIEFPQISGKVTSLDLTETAIEEVPSSIECLTDLEVLYLRNCKRLKRISTRFCKLRSLVDLFLNGCVNLERFPEILEKMEHLKLIYLDRTAITELPSSFENLLGLESLSVNYCSKLDKLPDNIGNLESLDYISAVGSSISQLPSSVADSNVLEILEFSRCEATSGALNPESSCSEGSTANAVTSPRSLNETRQDCIGRGKSKYIGLPALACGSQYSAIVTMLCGSWSADTWCYCAESIYTESGKQRRRGR